MDNSKNDIEISLSERLKEIRLLSKLPQRKITAELDIDTALTESTKKSEWRPKREYVVIIDELLQTDEKELLTLWLDNQVTTVWQTIKRLQVKY